MPAAPSLVLASSPRSWERLRDESGARAVAMAEDAALNAGGIRWIPLSGEGCGDVPDDSDGAWSARLRCVAASPQAPLVLLWVASRRGEAPAFLRSLDGFGARMIRLLQGDRVPPRVAAVVFVAEDGLDESDAVALETIACAGRNLPADAPEMPRGLAEVLGRRGRPVYLMSRRTRVGPKGESWRAADVWPVEVARLLASLEASGPRQPGIRAWRSLRFNPTRYPFEGIELEAFRFAREALGLPEPGATRVEEGKGRQLPVSRASDSLVPLDRLPQHCADSIARPGKRPEFPTWWDLPLISAESSARERIETFGSRSGRRSRWYERFVERGNIFINDRRERALQSVEETLGPKAVSASAWRAVHDDPALVGWYASGQFYVGPEARLDAPAEGLRQWSELSEVERRIIDLRVRCAIEGRELDVARLHFAGLGWRFACAFAAAVFIGTVFASIYGSSGWGKVVGVSCAAAAGSVLASGIVLWLEVLAGRRGRDAVESGVQHAESAISEGFLRRMRMGAEGERSGRRRRWFQTAARTRDSVGRLKAIVDISEINALRRAAVDAPLLPGALRDYVAATTVESQAAPLSVESLRRALREDPGGVVALRRRQYEAWWSEALRAEDPRATGAVRRRTFLPAVTQAVAALVDDFRRDLISVVEREGPTADSPLAGESRFGELMGPSGDLRYLGVQTQRAQGRENLRVVWVHAMIHRHATSAAADAREHCGNGVAPQVVASPVDRWGCLGLLVDEVAVGFRGGTAGSMCIDPDTGVCVWEGTDRTGPVASAGEAAP